MTHNRRDFLLATLAASTVGALPGLSIAATGNAADANFSKLLSDIAEEVLRLAPTSATGLGLDKDARAALKSQLEDQSPAGDAAWAAEVKFIHARLRTVDRKALSAESQTLYDSVAYAAESGIAGLRFPFGGAASGFYGGTAPFPVTQQDGALTRIPEFLDSQHQIANAADAEAYLERVAALARMMDQETARIAEQAGQGIAPPDFICRTALAQLQDFRKTAAAEQKLVSSITERTHKQNIAGDWHGRVLKLVEGSVYPALERQIAAFDQASAKATNVAGVHRLPDGAAYYEWALRLGTSTTRSAKEIHAIGLEQNKQLQSRIDAILKKTGHHQRHRGPAPAGLVQRPAALLRRQRQGPRRADRLLQRPRAGGAQADAADFAPGPEGAAADQARADRYRSRRAARLYELRLAGRFASGHLLHQPEIDHALAEVGNRHADRARRPAGPRLARRLPGRAPREAAADLVADRLQRLHRRLGAVLGTAGR
jgi:uncharacterized protein (DUF885 family)